MTLFFLMISAIAYFLDAPRVALAFVSLSILEQVLVMGRALIDPQWVVRRRIDSGVFVDFLRPGRHVVSLLTTKTLFLWILAFFAYHIYPECNFG